MNKNIKQAVEKKYNKFYTQIIPKSYFNLNSIQSMYKDIIRIKPLEEVGYAKFEVITYMSKTDGKGNSDLLETLNDKDIVPFMLFNMYVPLRNKVMECDEKNILTLSYINYSFSSFYYQQYNKETNEFLTPQITDKEMKYLSENTQNLVEYLVSKEKIIEKIGKQIKAIIQTEDFKNFDFSNMLVDFDYNNFMMLPNLTNTQATEAMVNKFDLENKKLFITNVQKIFLI